MAEARNRPKYLTPHTETRRLVSRVSVHVGRRLELVLPSTSAANNCRVTIV